MANLTSTAKHSRYKDPEYQKKYRARNIDRLKDYDKNRPNADERRKEKRRYYSSRPEVRARIIESRKQPACRYSCLVSKAKSRDITCTLTFERYLVLIECPCHYCGSELPEKGHGIDRFDNEQGYTELNSVPCCSKCNRVKCHFLSGEEMQIVAEALNQLNGDKAA